MVADDLEFNHQIFARMLKKEYIHAVIVSNGKDAVEIFKKNPPNYF